MALRGATGKGQGARITLDKRLPVASGIGGGSADAAAALRLLSKLWQIDLPEDRMLAIAADLGADVPACLRSRTVVGSGTGGRNWPRSIPDDVAGTHILLVNPLKSCPTGPVFKAWDGVDRGALDPHEWRHARNDLETPAMILVTEISAFLRC